MEVGTTSQYYAFGLSIISDIHLPELFTVRKQGQADIIIRKAEGPEPYNGMNLKQGTFAINGDHAVYFHVTDTAIFCVEGGERITYWPLHQSAGDKIRLYLLGTCMGIILMQKGLLPLHGSVVAADGKAYAFIGDSGAGKSTLASVLMKRGYSLLSDDVIAVSIQAGYPVVIPSYPQQKMWAESIDQLGMDAHHYQPLFEREHKYAIPVRTQFCDQCLPLVGVIELVKRDDGEIQCAEVEGLECLPLLYRHTYRQFLIARLGLMEWHFQTVAAMVDKVKLVRLQRSTQPFSANQLATLVEERIFTDYEYAMT